MVIKSSPSRKVFVFINAAFFVIICLVSLLPFIHVLALSFSSKAAAAKGVVLLWPVEFTHTSYGFVLQKPEFLSAIWISFKRVFLGLIVNMLMTIITAYPLSKSTSSFRFRTVYVWFFVFTMLFGGGLIPFYMIVKSMGLLDSVWALVLPGALPIFNAIILMNYFRGLPKELEESAFIDGAGHWRILWLIFIPISIPVLATLVLFTVVGHWNSWFDGMIFMTKTKNYPLQTYMQTLVIQPNSMILTQAAAKRFRFISERTVKSAQIFIGAIPVLMLYPFLQRYFITGLVLGSVKE